MDEFLAALKARELVKKIDSEEVPVDIKKYLAAVPECELREKSDLRQDEPGYSFKNAAGKYFIVINANDQLERQRFTALHELAHIVLDLPSQHSGSLGDKRAPNEICCDVFAAELLLPHRVFTPKALKATIGLDAIDELADQFGASFTATGSRFAAVTDKLCAFVISDQGKVRYAIRSNSLRRIGAWISPGMSLPPNSLSASRRTGDPSDTTREISADVWLADWRRGGVLLEEARYIKRFDQTLTLLWFDEDDVAEKPTLSDDGSDEAGPLDELDGILRFEKRIRKR